MQSFKSILFTISTFLSSLRNFSFVLLPKNFVVLPFTFTCNTFRVVFHIWSPLQFSSITQPCPTLCNPMDCSTPGFLVPHQLPEAVQTHVNQVGDAIQSLYPLSSPSPPAFNLSEHQGLFKLIFFFFFASGDQSIGVPASTSVIPMNTQDWFPLGWTGWISLQFKGPSRIFSNTSVQKHQFFSAQLSF